MTPNRELTTAQRGATANDRSGELGDEVEALPSGGEHPPPDEDEPFDSARFQLELLTSRGGCLLSRRAAGLLCPRDGCF